MDDTNSVSKKVIKVLEAAEVEVSRIKSVKRVEVGVSSIKFMFHELMLKHANKLFLITKVKTSSGEMLENVLIQEGGDWDYSISSNASPLVPGNAVVVSFCESPFLCGFFIETGENDKIFFGIPQDSEILRFRLGKSKVFQRA